MRFWVGGTGNWNDAAHWAATSGGAGGAGVPTVADDAVFDSASGVGTCTINAVASCRSLDSNNPTTGTSTLKTLAHGAFALTIGDATAGANNKALDLSGFTSYTINSVTTSTVTFASTSATQQSINTSGFSVASWTFNGVGGSWQLAAALTAAAAMVLTITNGSVDFNSKAVTIGRFSAAGTGNTYSLTTGTMTWTIQWNGSATAAFSLAANAGATIDMSLCSLKFTGSMASPILITLSAAVTMVGLELQNASPGGYKITGNTTATTSTIGTLTLDTPPQSVKFQAGRFLNVGTIVASGSAGNVHTFASDTPGSISTVNLANIWQPTFVSFQDLSFNPASGVDARGSGNVDSGNNHNVVFATPRRLATAGVG